MRRWMGICPLLACAALSACTGADEAGDENDESEELGQVSEAVETANMLSSNVLSTNTLTDNALTMNALTMNALTMNALTMNALTESTLTSLNDRAIASDTVSTRRGHLSRELLRYIYKCAMPKDKKMTLPLDDLEHPGQAEQVDFEGEIGLAPEWEKTECGDECEQWVSACVLARVNGYRVKVEISLRGTHPQLAASDEETAEYKNFEGRFWGNIFAGSTQQDHRACRGPGATLGHVTGRICASNGGNCSFKVDEDCTRACQGAICEGRRSVEVWLKNPPASDCGNGVCQTGESSNSCSMDCPMSVAITDHETSGHYVKTVAAAALDEETIVYAGFTDAPKIAGLDALDLHQESSKDIFVIKAKADGTYLAARRWAAADGDEITDVDANAAMGYVAVAINNKIRVLDPTTLNIYADIITGLAKVQNISSSYHSEKHWLEVVGTRSDNQPEWREYPVSGGPPRRSRLVDTTTGTWTQRVLDSCNAIAARPLSSSAIMVHKSSIGGEHDSFCGNGSTWSVTIGVPEMADPIPVAALPEGIIAGTNGQKTQSFIGRVMSGQSSWAWINRLSSPDSGRQVKITSAEVQGQVVVVAGEFRGPIDFAGTIPSPLPDRRLGVNANRDAFVAAYDLTTGALRWVRTYGGPGDDDALDAFTFDHSGRLWAFGTFEGTPTLDGTVAPGTDGDTGTDSMRVIVGPLPLNEQQALAVAPWGMVATQTDGTLWAWGDNSQGTLGPQASTTAPGSLPVEISMSRTSGTAAARAFGTAAGGAHALALGGAGVVWAWGDNTYGQLGHDTTTNPTTPLQVPGLQGIVAIAAGAKHSLALRGDGKVLAWGDDAAGQLGHGEASSTPSPTLVSKLDRITAIAAGEEHSLALRQDGTVWAWGNNANGQLGNGTTTASQVPVKVPTLHGITAIAAGAGHSLAVRGDGTVWAWGNNANGQLGDGTTTSRATPVQVSELGQVLRVAGGAGHSLALKADGTVWAFGSNSHGQLGVSTATSQRSTAAPVSGVSNAGAVACGGNSSAALLPTGDIRTWGENSKGQLGDGVLGQSRFLPTRVRGVFDSQTVAVLYQGLAARKDGTVESWGRNEYGELGNGAKTESRPAPARVPGISGVRSVATGLNWSMVLKKDGTVWAWGSNGNSKMGDGENCGSNVVSRIHAPRQIAGLSDVIQISAYRFTAYALKKDGTVWGWGRNKHYALGDLDGCYPAQIPGLNDIVAIDAGYYFALALKNDGTLWAWGRNNAGQLGNSETVDSPTPVRVKNLTNVLRFGAGGSSSAAITANGKIWTWGENRNGQLGFTGWLSRWMPVEISGHSSFIDVSVGRYHVLGIKADDTVWAWGNNSRGQLGDGTTEMRGTPMQLLSSIGAARVYAAENISMIIQTNRTLLGSGDNSSNQLGRRINMNGSTPQRLLDIQ
ncbi:RCC1-like domain-containing protein [Sorangium sp. So ce394]|uniref:RCC1-like domain-containing protein n=1 Tax=Sorangium sp. So ce394 TaxID=3133310 RepID=UPI003F5C771B